MSLPPNLLQNVVYRAKWENSRSCSGPADSYDIYGYFGQCVQYGMSPGDQGYLEDNYGVLACGNGIDTSNRAYFTSDCSGPSHPVYSSFAPPFPTCVTSYSSSTRTYTSSK
jgi:hypothetical protein